MAVQAALAFRPWQFHYSFSAIACLRVSASAKTKLTFDLKVNTPVVDLPKEAIAEAKDYANKSVKGKYTAAQKVVRDAEWGYHYNAYIRQYVENLDAKSGTVFRMSSQSGKGFFYIFKH